MALVSDITTVRPSGLNHIDALLDSGPGWNWLTPARSVLYYTFSVTSGNETGNSAISSITAFNSAQQSACLSQLAYISQLTGITFAAASSGNAGDIHFANTNITTSPSTSGLCSWSYSYNYNGSNTVTSYSTSAYVYLDNVEWGTQNSSPVAGNSGYETLLHELGHALGLKHPFQCSPTLLPAEDNTSNSVMSYTDSGGPYSTFRPYDVAALMWLYGDDGLGGSLGVSSSAVYLMGNASANPINGGIGNDKLEGLAGNDTINGGAGIDTAIYVGIRSHFTLTKTSTGFSVADTISTEGIDALTNIERLQFGDKKLALDLSPLEHGGQALEFIGLLAPGLISSPSIVGLILGLFDQGKSLHDVFQLALDIGLVNSIAGSSTDTALAAMAFRNLTGSEANAAMLDLLLSFMDGRNASFSHADFMTVLAGLELNQTHIGLVGLQQTGIEYI